MRRTTIATEQTSATSCRGRTGRFLCLCFSEPKTKRIVLSASSASVVLSVHVKSWITSFRP